MAAATKPAAKAARKPVKPIGGLEDPRFKFKRAGTSADLRATFDRIRAEQKKGRML